MLVAHVVRLAQTCGQGLVVVGQLCDHVHGFDVFRIVIEHALSASDVPDRSQRKSAKLSNSLGNWIGHRKKLIGLLVEQQMVITEMWTAHMPVEIFGLQVEREHISENGIHGAAYVFGGRT